jgi:uncharacterized protein (TIGR00661 family)
MKNVLVAPLDWGLGHATRCVPVIRELLKRKCNVSIAGSGDSLELLRKEFPFLKFFELIGYNPVYPLTRSGMVWKMASQLPKFFLTIRKEHEQIEQIVIDNSIDLIISDNRYGCWSANRTSIFITHQSSILMPKRFGLLAPLVRRFNRKFMSRFEQCWVPDFSGGNNLTGQLNSYARKRMNIFKFIGPLSRFEASKRKRDKLYDVTVILSGPEPQRTLLEKIIRVQLEATDLHYCIVRGVLNPASRSIAPNIYDNLTSARLQEVIESSDVIIARSGYSTVMDMAALRRKVIFIPTPGQTEQEYLAKTLYEKRIAFYAEQKKFDLQHALNESRNFTGFKQFNLDTQLLSDALDSLLGIKRLFKIS